VAVEFPAAARATAKACLARYPACRRDAARWLGVADAGSPTLHLVADHQAMAKFLGGFAPPWSVAVTRGDDTLVLRLDSIDSSLPLDVVLRHEATHQLLNHLEGARPAMWFEEGICVWLAGSRYLPSDTTIARLASAGDLPPLAELDAAFEGEDGDAAAMAYEAGRAAIAFLLSRHGQQGVQRVLEGLGAGKTFPDAFLDATGESLGEFEEAWRASVTPALPFVLYLLLENFDLALLCACGLLLVVGFVRYASRRRAAMEALGEGPLP